MSTRPSDEGSHATAHPFPRVALAASDDRVEHRAPVRSERHVVPTCRSVRAERPVGRSLWARVMGGPDLAARAQSRHLRAVLKGGKWSGEKCPVPSGGPHRRVSRCLYEPLRGELGQQPVNSFVRGSSRPARAVADTLHTPCHASGHRRAGGHGQEAMWLWGPATDGGSRSRIAHATAGGVLRSRKQQLIALQASGVPRRYFLRRRWTPDQPRPRAPRRSVPDPRPWSGRGLLGARCYRLVRRGLDRREPRRRPRWLRRTRGHQRGAARGLKTDADTSPPESLVCPDGGAIVTAIGHRTSFHLSDPAA